MWTNTIITAEKRGYQRTDEEHYAELEKLAGDHYIEYVIIDPSAASFKATIKRHGKFYVKSAKNDVINGIRTTSQMLSNGRIKIGVKCKAISGRVWHVPLGRKSRGR